MMEGDEMADRTEPAGAGVRMMEDTPGIGLGEEQRVTPLELFFDLVFVFAFTQVTALMAADPVRWTSVGEGMLVLATIWWTWSAYGWLTNTIDPEEVVARLSIFLAMAAMLVCALAIPEAFDDYGVLFACAFFVVRTIHILLYAYGSPSVDVLQAVKGLIPGVGLACALLVVAGTQDGALQAGLWIAALLFDYLAPQLGGFRGWTVHPSHFAERFGLILIIALGESIVAIGVGLEGVALDLDVIVAATLGLITAAALWWAYFDVVAPVGERRLRAAEGLEQIRLARDAYSYIHLLLIAGVVLLALGIKKSLEHLDQPLEDAAAFALCAGVALYLLGNIAFRLRNLGTLNRQRTVAAGVCLALIPLAANADALLALAAIAAVLTALVAYEALQFREARARVRAAL
jgi:low temperature requirement protein LtrA